LKRLFSFTEQFFWTMVWVFLALIAGYAILAFIQAKAGGTILGTGASWVTSHSDPIA